LYIIGTATPPRMTGIHSFFMIIVNLCGRFGEEKTALFFMCQLDSSFYHYYSNLEMRLCYNKVMSFVVEINQL
jgi:hypothetical protein